MPRRNTRTVFVGKIGLGSAFPVRIQSMTNTPTEDIEATVDQIKRLADHGCEIARVAVAGQSQAMACERIKNLLLQSGYDIPLVADVHFQPKAALTVADFVDKVRINPGNFSKEKSSTSEMDARVKIEESLFPLLEKCRRRKIPIRIGVNHGSLSPRILEQFGNTPKGMVISALEYAQICRNFQFHDLVFSMKASSIQVMIDAYRLLIFELDQRGFDYPIHLGVTEAGMEAEGRIKSAIGIGTLLKEGIGDTIRVSLTEDPVQEIKAAQDLLNYCPATSEIFEKKSLKGRGGQNFLHPECGVILPLSEKELQIDEMVFLEKAGFLEKQNRRWARSLACPDGFLLSKGLISILERKLECLDERVVILSDSEEKGLLAAYSYHNGQKQELPEGKQSFLWIEAKDNWDKKIFSNKKSFGQIIFQPNLKGEKFWEETKKFLKWVDEREEFVEVPVFVCFSYPDSDYETFLIKAGSDLGSLCLEEAIDGVILDGKFPLEKRREAIFSILQCAGKRISKTEYISCPGCGRTLFNIEEVTRRIKRRTERKFPGIKIAIMGCIVNGPGEMGEADFGYIGSKRGKVDLYVKQKCIMKDVDEKDAEERLIEVIERELTADVCIENELR